MSKSVLLSVALAVALLPSHAYGYIPQSSGRTVTALSMSTTSRNFSAQSDVTKEINKTSASISKMQQQNANKKTTKNADDSLENQPWQVCVEELLDPVTPLPRRQALLAKLVNANKDIQESVLTALRDRKIDGLLTPTGKKLQDGTQTVARQITNDILPNLAKNGAAPPTPRDLLPDPNDVSKVGSRILNALSNQVQRNLEVLQGDLANPVRNIPQRISSQTQTLVTETRNVFSETPVGLQEPPYTVVAEMDDYEIRDYEGYSVASTSMGKGVILDGEKSAPNMAGTGAAFNTLAAYLFGANKQGESMEMTTPVTTTSWGEMRFYLSRRNADDDNIPDPLDDASSGSLYETGSVTILDIPPARLAVRKFTGFVTEGEVTRQKDALLSALMMDDVELDVAHGDPISHVIFQYNPPYTLPIVRRNEIAVVVRREEDDVVDLKEEWGEEDAAVAAAAVMETADPAAGLNKVNGSSYASATTSTTTPVTAASATTKEESSSSKE